MCIANRNSDKFDRFWPCLQLLHKLQIGAFSKFLGGEEGERAILGEPHVSRSASALVSRDRSLNRCAMRSESGTADNQGLPGVAAHVCNSFASKGHSGAPALGLLSRLLSSLSWLLPAVVHAAERRLGLQALPTREKRAATALLLIDVQPEWFSESEISRIFPHLRETIPELLATCRAAGLNARTYARTPRTRKYMHTHRTIPES